MPLSPWKWKLLVEDRDSYRMTGLTLADIFLSWPFRLGEPYRKPDPEQWRQLREALPIFDGYARFASFPAVRGEYALKCSDLLEIDFHDLRYYPADDSDLMHKAGRGGGMFLMRLRINARNNTLASWSYLENAAGAAGDEWVELDPPIPLGLVRW